MSSKGNNCKQSYKQKQFLNELDKYEVIKLLGEGSFGRVYKAKVIADSSFVALKVICKKRRSNKEIIGLRRECEIQKHLHHPNIIQMLDSFETENEIVVVTEFAQKELNTVLIKEKYLPEERVAPVIWDLVSALNYLHLHRILHRDLKPQNILIDSNNKAKLCDFGFARNMSTRTHVLTSIKGTPLYMAPELIEEQPYDYKADLWSLGCIMYELLVGAPPFSTSSILHLIRLIRREQIQWPTFVSESCIAFLRGLLQKDPAKRFNWDAILNHDFVKGHILICNDVVNMPLTRTLSDKTLQAKEQQHRDHVNKKKLTSHSTKKEGEEEKPENDDSSQDMKNNNLTSKEQVKSDKEWEEKDFEALSSSKRLSKFHFIEENHPIETEEWIVFLQKSMEEVIHGEMTSLTQPNLMNIIISPLRNTNTNSKVLTSIAKLLSIPFVIREVSEETLEQMKKVYLELKLVSNLVYSSKLLMRIKGDEKASLTSSQSTQQTTEDSCKSIVELNEEDLESLENIYMLITHLVYKDNEFLSQLCDAIAILNIFNIIKFFLLMYKSRIQVVIDILAILTHILRIYPENVEIIDKIVLNEATDEKGINFVELLRHNNPLLKERACLLLLFLGKYLPTCKMENIWNETVRETLEALMFDSIETVRNAAYRTVEELKYKDFYKATYSNLKIVIA